MPLIGTLTSGVSALNSFTKGMEVIGNNIANVNTTAYKSSRTSFAESFSNTLQSSSPSTATTGNTAAIQVGTGVQLSSITADYTQGDLASTGSGTDLAISGNGFFYVKDPADGTAYVTRAGEFHWDDQGYLVTAEGYRVQGSVGGTGSDIQLAQNLTGKQRESVSIDTSGNITEFYSDGSSASTSQLILKNFSDPSALMKQGGNLYTGFDAAGEISFSGTSGVAGEGGFPNQNGLGKIQANALELSNVDLTEEFANMITTQRSFQAASRLVTVSDTILEDVVNLKR